MNEMEQAKPQWWIGAVLALAAAGAVFALATSNRTGERESAPGQALRDGMLNAPPTDPALVLYEEITPRIDTGFEWARLIAVGPDGAIYATGGNHLRAFGSAGGRLPLEIEAEDEITALTVADDGSIYLAVGDRIEARDSNGGLRSRWESAGPKSMLVSLAVSGGDLFAADFGTRSVIRYGTDGVRKGGFGDFVLPSYYFDVAIGGDGMVLVANTGEHRIETHNFDGDLMSWWGSYSGTDPKGFCGCCNPVNFALLPDGGFVTCEKGISRVKIYDSDGNFEGFAAGHEAFEGRDALCAAPDYCFSQMGLDVAVDSAGRVLVLDPAMAEIRVYTKKTAAPDA